MKINRKGFSIVEVLVSLVILSIFLTGAYSGINNFYNVINYIDSNVNGLNLTKTSIDQVISIRNKYLQNFPQNGWEVFVYDNNIIGEKGTYKISQTECNNSGTLNGPFLCSINDKKNEYNGPLDIFGNITNDKSKIHFYNKIDLQEENKFYLKNISRYNTGTGEILKFKFTDKIYNKNNFVVYSGFDNIDLEVYNDLGLDYYNFDGVSNSNPEFNNLNNKNLRFSKVFSYDELPQNNDYISFSYSGGSLIKKIIFYETNLPTLNQNEIPIKIDSNIDKNYYNLCKEINNISGLKCDFNFILKDNIYSNLIGNYKEFSGIDFGEDYSFSFSGANNNEIWLYLSGNLLPSKNNFLYINPSNKLKFNKNLTNDNDILSVISDATAGRGVLIPDLPSPGQEKTSTGYTSLLNLTSTTLLYDGTKFIDSYVIETKIGDINRYIK